jgi:hypothetical protein
MKMEVKMRSKPLRTIWRVLSVRVTLLALLWAFNVIAAAPMTSASTKAAKQAAVVKRIRADYQRINAARKTFKAETTELMGFSVEGGEAELYRNQQGQIELIKASLYGEMGRQTHELYLKNQRLIFVFSREEHYNVPFYIHEPAEDGSYEAFDPKKSSFTEARYYFDQQKLIRWLDADGKAVEPSDPKFLEMQDYFLRMGRAVLTVDVQLK